MKHLLIKVQTAYALGLVNLWRAYLYRLGVKLRLNPVYKLNATLPPNVTFFDEVVEVCQHDLKPNTQWVGQHSYFSWFQYKSNNPPQWHLNPFNGKKVRHAEYNWWNIADFDPDVGDIKTVWEASRFDWVLGFAQLGALGDEKALKTLNYWLNDWCNKNPPYKGPNWKCGQESSIRVMHLSIAASILNQYQSSPDSLIQLI